MIDETYKALLRLICCSDPWPVDDADNELVIKAFADAEAKKRGFKDWVDAYHEMP